MRTAALLLTLAFGSRLIAADPKPADKPIPTKDAAKAMTVPEGFKVTLFAGEPDVVQPIAFTFDDRGRMWVVECLSYPNWRKDGKGSDRVLIFEDTDGDGTFDKRTVFLDNGSNLSGIELGFGGVWLCSSPNLIFIPILEGDKPGKPEIVLDGWNMIDTKHNIFNSLGWGPDGWLYGCNGIQAKAWVGTPGTPKEKRTYIDCGVWRYHPTRKVFEAVAHGTTNPFGLDWDEYGEMFVTNCVIDHLFHFVPGGHYERMYGQDANPYVYGLMKSCVDYKHWAGGDWTTSRSTGVGGDPKQSDAGGGHAHSGCAIYLGDNFPAEYRNTLFTCNIHGNRLNNDGLARTPSGYKGVRRKDFLFANDSWFRGICVKTGPDSALYVSDWCDTGECHNYDKADITNGRIYRVSYGNPTQWKGDVSKLSDAELVKLQLSPNDWFVRHARRVLQERAAAGKLEKGTADGLRAILKDEKDVPRRLRALWALEVIGKLIPDDLFLLLKSSDEAVRAWAFRLLFDSNRKLDATLTDELYNAAGGEKSPYVRLHIAGASTMRPLGPDIHNLAARIAGWEEDNPQVLLMMWYAIEQAARTQPDYALTTLRENVASVLRRNAVRYVIARGEKDLPRALDKILIRMPMRVGPKSTLSVRSQIDVLTAMTDELAGRKDVPRLNTWQLVFDEIKKDTTPEAHRTRRLRTAEALGVIFGDQDAIAALSNRARDTTAEPEERRAAIEVLTQRKLPTFAKTLRGLLDDPAVRQAAIRGLAAFADADTPAAILKAYAKFTSEEKLDAVNTLAARKEWANALLDAIEKGSVPRADVPVTTARQILALNDKPLAARLDKAWGKIGSASKERAALTKKWKEVLTDDALAKADASRGRAIFVKHCATCHKMFGEGAAVGPELTGSQRANLDYVLENVLDPSAVVPNEYRLINFTLTDDRLVSGIILRETKDAITVRTTNETVIVPTSDIATRKQTNLSIMPDGLLDQMKSDEVRDLVAYLRKAAGSNTEVKASSIGFRPMLTRGVIIFVFAVFAGVILFAADRPTTPAFKAGRSATLAPNGMVATSHPLAAQVGLEVLRRGGNAVDAAIATSAAMGVVEPTTCGIGGDLYAIVWDAKTQKLYGLNASGRAPGKATLQYFKDKGLKDIPTSGPLSWSVPGCVDGWDELRRKFGTMSFKDLLVPSIEYAEKGAPVPEVISGYWRSVEKMRDPGMRQTFLIPDGNGGQHSPRPGDVFKNPGLANSLKLIAANGRDAYYKGEIAEKIVATSDKVGGLFSLKDFADHKSEWVEPVKTTYRGYDVWEIPPPSQGITTLQMLNLLEPHDLKKLGPNSAEYWHLLVEAKKIAFADRAKFYADPVFAKVPVAELISKEYAEKRAKLFDPKKALTNIPAGDPKLSTSETIYLCVVDKDHNCVSLIQSNYAGFGSGVAAPGVGFGIQNRGCLFALDENHANKLEPGKRPFHTIIPAMVTKDGKPWFTFGVMGGDMQPQGHVQILVNMIDFGMNVQQAGEAPRVEHVGSATPTGTPGKANGGTIRAEPGIPDDVVKELTARGHTVERVRVNSGGYQGILIDPKTGMLHGGSEPRKDGAAVGY